jgi:hypothetical protein
MSVAFAPSAFPMENGVDVRPGMEAPELMNVSGAGTDRAAAARRRPRREQFGFNVRLVGDADGRRILRNHQLLPLLAKRLPATTKRPITH